MEIVGIKYYNVMFVLRIKTEMDQMAFRYFSERIIAGEIFKMKLIALWCESHGIAYSYKFRYRKEYPIRANIWNFYSYCRFRIEENLRRKSTGTIRM